MDDASSDNRPASASAFDLEVLAGKKPLSDDGRASQRIHWLEWVRTLEEERRVLRTMHQTLRLAFASLKGSTSQGTSQAILSAAERKNPPAAVDIWRTGDSPSALLSDEENVFLFIRPEQAKQLESSSPALEIEIGLQLHVISKFPLVGLTVVIGEHISLFHPIDIREADQRDILELLSRNFIVYLETYDEESRPVSSWRLAAELDENAREILRRSERLVHAFPAGNEPSFPDICALHESKTKSIGAVEQNIPLDGAICFDRNIDTHFEGIESASHIYHALKAVSYWSEPANEAKLIYQNSFPLRRWREIQFNVCSAAERFGLRLPDPRLDKIIDDVSPVVKGSPTCTARGSPIRRSDLEIIQANLHQFARVSTQKIPNDLSIIDEWIHWKALMGACENHQIAFDYPELARQAAHRARLVFERTLAPIVETDAVELEEIVSDVDIVSAAQSDSTRHLTDEARTRVAKHHQAATTLEISEEDILFSLGETTEE